MFVIIGNVVAIGCIFGAYIVHGGNISVIIAALPTEMLAIAGGSLRHVEPLLNRRRPGLVPFEDARSVVDDPLSAPLVARPRSSRRRKRAAIYARPGPLPSLHRQLHDPLRGTRLRAKRVVAAREEPSLVR